MRAVVVGAGPAGLSSAMLLAESGLDVVVLDRDASMPPDDSEDPWDWERPGVSQFKQAHTLLPMGRLLLESHIPEAIDELKALRARRFDLLEHIPPGMEWTPQADDDRFWSLAATRPVYETAFARAAAERGGFEVRRGVSVTGLLSGHGPLRDVPHVTGVRTKTGEAVEADLVIDASGRRSALPQMLEEIGAQRPPEESEDSRFVYYTRFYRKTDDGDFPNPYTIFLYPAGSITILTLPGDGDRWSVTLFATTADKAMRAVRDPDVFESVLRAHPLLATWVDGEPLTDVHVMAGVTDRTRPLFIDGSPAATGIIPVADAWACTNPSLGRGISMALMHIAGLMPAVVEHIDDPAELAHEWQRITESEVQPWHQATLELDRRRNAEMDAIRLGRTEPDHIPSVFFHGDDPDDAAFFAAMGIDQHVLRAGLEMTGMFATLDEVRGRSHVRQTVEAMKAHDPKFPEPQIPSRAELESLLS